MWSTVTLIMIWLRLRRRRPRSRPRHDVEPLGLRTAESTAARVAQAIVTEQEAQR